MRTTFILLTWTLGLQTLSALDWPQWRGPNRDGVSKETGLLKSWPAAGPARAWIFSNAGAGYSSFSIANGKLSDLDLGVNNNPELRTLEADSYNG